MRYNPLYARTYLVYFNWVHLYESGTLIVIQPFLDPNIDKYVKIIDLPVPPYPPKKKLLNEGVVQ